MDQVKQIVELAKVAERFEENANKLLNNICMPEWVKEAIKDLYLNGLVEALNDIEELKEKKNEMRRLRNRKRI